MKLTQTTQDWGNSTGIRLPKKVLQTVRWEHNQVVTIDVQGQSLVLSPVKELVSEAIRIEELLEGVRPQEVGGETDWGAELGVEIIDD